ncbi:putative PAP2 superfamily [Blattamonas nauphoetae]|uniref:PAP2 superfamily n=1 Tax=Blattamonas nauphoetae TaxID=2049346 RepID=A0ABQ9YG11_9EUKA|nr:putative PAP2 superfamily [Blattamonas nauphoetae]
MSVDSAEIPHVNQTSAIPINPAEIERGDHLYTNKSHQRPAPIRIASLCSCCVPSESDDVTQLDITWDDIKHNCTCASIFLFIVELVLSALAAFGFIFELFPRFKKTFHFDDPTFSYPFTHEEWVSSFGSILFVLVYGVASTLISQIFMPYQCLSLQAAAVAVVSSLCSVMGVVSILKLFIPRFRPDFIDRCRPDPAEIATKSAADISLYGHVLAHDWTCTGMPGLTKKAADHLIKEGRMSFPSGHSASSMWAAFISISFAIELAWMIAKCSRNLRRNMANPCLCCCRSLREDGPSEPVSRQYQFHIDAIVTAVVIAVSIALFTASIFVVGSRISDSRHHTGDVIGGSIIGALGGIFGGVLYHIRRRALIVAHQRMVWDKKKKEEEGARAKEEKMKGKEEVLSNGSSHHSRQPLRRPPKQNSELQVHPAKEGDIEEMKEVTPELQSDSTRGSRPSQRGGRGRGR